MSENVTVKPTFYQRVTQFVTGGDERKTMRFHKKFIKDNDEQINLRKKQIDDASERKTEVMEKLKESLFKIDMDKIDTIDLTNDYVPVYRAAAISVLVEKKELEKKIKVWETEIAQFEQLNGLVK